MLKQLANLSIETDGRYATDEELQFLQDYLRSIEPRIHVYEKLRQHAEEIIELVEEEKQITNPYLFQMKGYDITDICRRDMTNIFRCTAAAMLIGDLDRLREGLLIWYQTLVRAYDYTRYAQINYRLIQEMVKRFLTPEEMEFILPALQLNQTILSA